MKLSQKLIMTTEVVLWLLTLAVTVAAGVVLYRTLNMDSAAAAQHASPGFVGGCFALLLVFTCAWCHIILGTINWGRMAFLAGVPLTAAVIVTAVLMTDLVAPVDSTDQPTAEAANALGRRNALAFLMVVPISCVARALHRPVTRSLLRQFDVPDKPAPEDRLLSTSGFAACMMVAALISASRYLDNVEGGGFAANLLYILLIAVACGGMPLLRHLLRPYYYRTEPVKRTKHGV